MASRSTFLRLLVVVGLLGGPAAHAQIVREKPGQIKAANRRALREAKHTDSPYKDSHLDVTAARLRRGESTQPLPENSPELDYKTGTAPNVKASGFLGQRRRKSR